jgi:hypothetical protein
VGSDLNSAVCVEAPYTDNPQISTGAGEHFNAGFCLGRLLGCNLDANIQLGVATSGYYVREAKSPALAQLSGFIHQILNGGTPVDQGIQTMESKIKRDLR